MSSYKVKIWKKIQSTELFVRSAALAYHTLLGIVPLLGLVFWYLKRIGLTEQWIQALRVFVLERINVSSSAEFLKVFDKITLQTKGQSWGWIGLVLLSYSAMNLVAKFGQGLDAVLGIQYQSEKTFTRWMKVWRRRVLGFLGLPVALSVSLFVSQNWGRRFWEIPLLWFCTSLSVFFVYYFIPSRKFHIKKCLKVSLIVGPVLELLRMGLGFYSQYAVSVHKMYGVFAVIPLFILWIQLSWAVLLGGALGLGFLSDKKDSVSWESGKPDKLGSPTNK